MFLHHLLPCNGLLGCLCWLTNTHLLLKHCLWVLLISHYMSLQLEQIGIDAWDLPSVTAGPLPQSLQQHLDFTSQQLFDCWGVGQWSNNKTCGSRSAPALLHQIVPHLCLKQTNTAQMSVRTWSRCPVVDCQRKKTEGPPGWMDVAEGNEETLISTINSLFSFKAILKGMQWNAAWPLDGKFI